MNSLLRALALFTVAPVPVRDSLTRTSAVRAVRWLPAVGAALGALAALPAAAVLRWAPHATLLGAVAVIALLAMLTRGLHLDGLADTADGLGARTPAAQALAIMRRPDIGPFGVASLVLVLLIDVAAVAALGGPVWRPVAGVAVAAATGRLAVLLAARGGVPAARPDGFGAHVAASQPVPVLVIGVVAVLGFGVAMAAATGASLLGWPAAQAAALLACLAFQLHATRRLGGVTGDVFGALVEVGTALTLAGLAVA